MTALQVLALSALSALWVTSRADGQSLDYTFFKERVQPIFLKKRPGHARCVTCHDHGSPPLQSLAADAVVWNEEQSRKNYAVWRQLVVPRKSTEECVTLASLGDGGGRGPLSCWGQAVEVAGRSGVADFG